MTTLSSENVCVICGKTLEGRQKVVCSSYCSSVFRKRYKLKCKVCGSYSLEVYCTLKCKQISESEHYKSLNDIERKYYAKNIRTGRLVVNRRRKLKELAVAYKGGKCQICGYEKCIDALEFHHIDPSKKDFGIGSCNKSWEKIKLELTKCLLVCSNCHREIHADFFASKKLETLSKKMFPTTEILVNEDSARIRREKKIYKCLTCNCIVKRGRKYCISCRKEKRKKAVTVRPHKIQWPTKEELEQLIITTPMTTIGKMLGVSDNAIRKHARSCGIILENRAGYWAKKYSKKGV